MFKCEAISSYVPLSSIYIFVFYILGTIEKRLFITSSIKAQDLMAKIYAPDARNLYENMQNIFIFSGNVMSYTKSMSLLIYYSM